MTEDSAAFAGLVASYDQAKAANELERACPPELEPDEEPCYMESCRCCRIWIDGLNTLRDSMVAHVKGELRLKACSPDCLVCGTTAWQGQ